MKLDRLTLTNFKNYREADVTLCDGVNCFVGNNGAGKTNLLDAVYYLSFCKSYFNPVDSQNIRIGEDFFALHGHYGSEQASCIVRRGKGKEMRWAKKSCRTLSEHIGRIPLVMISPSDQQIITGGSDVRRKFVDGVISQTDHSYLDHIIQYAKALDQRNRLLKQMWEDRLFDEAMLAIWDEQLCVHGDSIFDARRRFVADFSPIFRRYYCHIASEDEPGVIDYNPSEEPLLQQLVDCRQADKYSQYTNAGPHKDDFLFMLAPEMPVKRFGSQGQQKTFSLALKLAQFEYIQNHCGEKPILLLDDIFDKLDLDRIRQLIALVGGQYFGQVLLTDTQPGRIQAIIADLPGLTHRLFTVENGTVVQK